MPHLYTVPGCVLILEVVMKHTACLSQVKMGSSIKASSNMMNNVKWKINEHIC